ADTGGTPSTGTGPSIDHTLGTNSGTYLYLEASGGCTGQAAHLTSPCLDIPSGTTELRFWYHSNGDDVGSLHIDALESSGWNEDISTPISGSQGDNWLEKVVDISAYAGEGIKLRIRGVTGGGWSSDTAIDDITIENTPPDDLTADFSASPREGCEGTTVDFTDLTEGVPTGWNWTFTGGTPASSTSQNPSITYNTAGTYAVSLTANDANNNNTITKQTYITIFTTPTANITGNLQVCDSGSTTLTASGGVSYLWNTGSTNASITVSPLVNTDYSVTVTDANGCTDTHQVTVSTNTSSSISITANFEEICEGQSTLLVATTGASYSWSTGAITKRIPVTPTENTTYSVVVTDDNGCTGSAEITITVNPPIIADISGNLEICTGGNTTLTASGGNTYHWSTNSNNAAITTNPTENTIYTVTVTNAEGCSDTEQVTVIVSDELSTNISGDLSICNGESTTLTASGGTIYNWSTGSTTTAITVNPIQNTTYTVTVSDASDCSGIEEVNVVVNPNPNADITGDFTTCNGESTTLTASGGISYDWNTGSTATAINVTPAQNTDYSVVVTDANGCTDAHTITVNVNPNPTAGITGDFTICNGESTTLTASGGTSYDWNTGSNATAITVNPTQNTDYSVIATDANGCTGTHQITVTVSENPSADITGDFNICNGENTTLTASGGTSYDWNTGSNATAINVTPTEDTDYSVIATDANGCTDTHQITVTVHDNPTANISGTLDICADESTTLTASGGVSYSWNTGSTNAAITVSPTSNTNYIVTAMDENGCTDTHEVTVSVGTGENCCVTVVSIEYENNNALPPCVTADDYIKAGDYGAGSTIVQSNQAVQFTAGNYISFDPGFSVESGGVLNAKITAVVPPLANETQTLKTALDIDVTSNKDTQLLISPNPFTTSTSATHQLFAEAVVSLSVYDLAGKKVELLLNNQNQIEGKYKVSFESCNLKPGVYLCVLEIDGERRVSKLLKQ
ncbi:MAG: PKD domain-containing protein, partial [Chitinophagales bacterium]